MPPRRRLYVNITFQKIIKSDLFRLRKTASKSLIEFTHPAAMCLLKKKINVHYNMYFILIKSLIHVVLLKSQTDRQIRRLFDTMSHQASCFYDLIVFLNQDGHDLSVILLLRLFCVFPLFNSRPAY